MAEGFENNGPEGRGKATALGEATEDLKEGAEGSIEEDTGGGSVEDDADPSDGVGGEVHAFEDLKEKGPAHSVIC